MGLKECFTIGVMGSCWYQIIKGVIISVENNYWPSSRTLPGISICIFRLYRLLHCAKEVNLSHFPKFWRASLGKRNEREKSLMERKSMTVLFAFPVKIFGPRWTHSSLRWSREATFPANLNGPLCYETCPSVQYIHIDTHLNKVKKKKNLWISVGRKLEVHEADPHHTDQKFSEDDDNWDTFSVSTPIRTIRNTDPHACQQRHEIKSWWPVPILE